MIRHRALIFAVLSASCLVVAASYVVWAVLRETSSVQEASAASPSATRPMGSTASSPMTSTTIAVVPSEGRVMFRRTAIDDTYGTIGLVPLATPAERPNSTSLSCERVHYAAGHGTCLVADRGVLTTYRAVIFGPDFQPRHTLPLSGIPSRTRVSPDGRYAAITVFVSGHSYAAGTFSTLTTLIDATTGKVVGDLEQFAVVRNEQPFRSPDFNFWGVTFTRDSNQFYATLASGGQTYLVEGEIATRQMRVLRENVECPSLSPDNTRVVYKKQVGSAGRSEWRLHVLDLATLSDKPLAETRSVDDQVEWLDDGRIMYALPDDRGKSTAIMNVWVLPSDGSGAPQIFLSQASSPTLVQ